MGCDIHAYIECYSKRDNAQSQKCYVNCVAKDVYFGRNYQLFGLLAGVRGISSSVFQPRGLPSNPQISGDVEYEYYKPVIENDEISKYTSQLLSHEYVSRTEADKLVQTRMTEYGNSDKTKIIKPGLHTPHWLNLNELLLVRKHYLIENLDTDYYSQNNYTKKVKKELINFISKKDERILLKYCFENIECEPLYCILNAMLSMEKCSDDNYTRLVFWFDS